MWLVALLCVCLCALFKAHTHKTAENDVCALGSRVTLHQINTKVICVHVCIRVQARARVAEVNAFTLHTHKRRAANMLVYLCAHVRV